MQNPCVTDTCQKEAVRDLEGPPTTGTATPWNSMRCGLGWTHKQLGVRAEGALVLAGRLLALRRDGCLLVKLILGAVILAILLPPALAGATAHRQLCRHVILVPGLLRPDLRNKSFRVNQFPSSYGFVDCTRLERQDAEKERPSGLHLDGWYFLERCKITGAHSRGEKQSSAARHAERDGGKRGDLTVSRRARRSCRGALVGRSASPERKLRPASADRSAPNFWDSRALWNAGSMPSAACATHKACTTTSALDNIPAGDVTMDRSLRKEGEASRDSAATVPAMEKGFEV